MGKEKVKKGFRKIVAAAMACMLILACAGCGNTDSGNTGAAADSPANGNDNISGQGGAAGSNAADETVENGSGAEGGVLIVYFSHSGNTHKLAEMIQTETGADIFRLTPVEAYGDDLFERAQDELNNGIRPELTELPEQEVIDQYDTILLGFPIWWYDLPMPVWTFLEGCDLSGKTIIPFFTHNGSSNGAGSLSTIEELCPDSTVRSDDALSIPGRSADGSETEVKEWLTEIGLAQ